MQIIQHRCNSILDLRKVDYSFGVEIDIRSDGNELILQHDPFASGESLLSWINSYSHNTLILNVKEEGLEERLLKIMRQYNIENFFFLDQSFPFLLKTIKQGERRCAIRISEYESIETALSLAGKVDWVWIDYFSYFPLDIVSATTLQKAGFKICIVSPELQGYPEEVHIPKLRTMLQEKNIDVHAVCTKNPQLWF